MSDFNSPLHEWLAPVTTPQDMDQIFADSVLRVGDSTYLFLSNSAITEEASFSSPLLVSNLPQEKLYPTTPRTLEMVGTDAGDVAVMQIRGLNADGLWKARKFQLTGTTPVDIGVWLRVFEIELVSGPGLQGGAYIYDPAEGALDPSGAYTYVYAPATLPNFSDVDAHRSYDSTFVIPKGYNGYVRGFNFFSSGRNNYVMFVQARNLSQPGSPWQTVLTPAIESDSVPMRFEARQVPEMTEVRILVQRTNVFSGNVFVNVEYQIACVANTDRKAPQDVE